MKRTNRKGFTTVELVIVIAVIAILAAVLIPTFVSLINKANQSSDIQAARAMDTALQTESAAKAPTELEEVIEILDAAGFNVDSLQPITKDCTFYWSLTLNKILLINDAEGNILYPNKVDAKPTDSQNLMDGKGHIKAEVSGASGVMEAISGGLGATLTDNIDDLNSITVNVGDDVAVDLGGKTVTAAERQPGVDHQYAFNVYGTLTLTNGVIDARGVEVRSGGKLIIGEGVTIKAADNNGGAAIYLYPGAEVVINGGTFTAEACKDELTGGSVVLNAGGKLTINGGTFTSNVNGPYVVNHQGGETIINDGVFNASRGVVCATAGTLTINGGTFKKTSDLGSSYVVYAGGSGVVNVKGGSFTTVGAENTLYCENGGTINGTNLLKP